RILGLWRRGRPLDRGRAVLLAVGLGGGWAFLVAALVDLSVELAAWAGPRFQTIAGALGLGGGLGVLCRADTESGHIPLLAVLAVLTAWSIVGKGRTFRWNRRRVAWAFVTAWCVPVAALLAGGAAERGQRWAQALVGRCRFFEVPTDDVERLA